MDAAEWEAMLTRAATHGGERADFPARDSTRVLSQDEMDSLLGFDDGRERNSKYLRGITETYNLQQLLITNEAVRSLHNHIGQLLKIIRELDEEIELLKMAENRPCPYPEGPCAERRDPTLSSDKAPATPAEQARAAAGEE